MLHRTIIKTESAAYVQDICKTVSQILLIYFVPDQPTREPLCRIKIAHQNWALSYCKFPRSFLGSVNNSKNIY